VTISLSRPQAPWRSWGAGRAEFENCRAGEDESCALYHECVRVRIEPSSARRSDCVERLQLPEELCDVSAAYLVCEYKAKAASEGRGCGGSNLSLNLTKSMPRPSPW
jgi:hypothetical protein